MTLFLITVRLQRLCRREAYALTFSSTHCSAIEGAGLSVLFYITDEISNVSPLVYSITSL